MTTRITQIVMPTHDNCTEVVADFEDAGLHAVKYPARMIEGTEVPCPRCNGEKGNNECSICDGEGWFGVEQNCWNGLDANAAEEMGLPLIKTVCLKCEHRETCESDGYLHDVDAAKHAEVSVATHARATMNSLEKLCDERRYVSIHESAVDTLRPTMTVQGAELNAVCRRLDELLRADSEVSVLLLNFLGSGNTDNQKAQRDACYDFLNHLLDLCKLLLKQLGEAMKTCEVPLDNSMKRPPGIERLLFREFRDLKFESGPFKVLLDAADGSLYALGIVVVMPAKKEGDDKPAEPIRKLLGVWKNDPPKNCAVWFSDATANEERLVNLLGDDVHNKTPNGHLKLLKKATQIPRDITRGTNAAVVQGLVRGVLANHQQYRRVGVICHRNHSEAIEKLGHPFESRIVKVAYFGSGDERSSNDWHRTCDFIIVAGTPRLPPKEIPTYLAQVGEFATAGRDGQWGDFRWRGETESGQKRVIAGRGYADPDWQQAYRELVRAGIVQAIGRGRGILEDGCDVLVLSTEECGLLLAEVSDDEPINETAMRAFHALKQLTEENPNKYIIGNTSDNRGVPTAAIASRLDIVPRTARDYLNKLECGGLVVRCGERKGWLPAASGDPPVSEER